MRDRLRLRKGLFALFLLLIAPRTYAAEPGGTLKLWHAYRGKEELALQQAVAVFSKRSKVKVELLALPYDVFASKLIVAIPHGNGPDVFIFSHTRIVSFEQLGLLAPIQAYIRADEYVPHVLDALKVDGRLFGYPMSVKCLALYVNSKLVPRPPRTTRELLRLLPALSRPQEGRFGLAYEAGNFYYHEPFLFGFGGKLFDQSGRAVFNTLPMARSLAFVKNLQDAGFMPQETSGALIKSLFNMGKAAMVINGPWFAGEISSGVAYKVAPLPQVSETGLPMSPLLDVEAAMVSSRSTHPKAQELAYFLSQIEASGVLARVGRQIPSNVSAYGDTSLGADPYITAFRRAAQSALVLPSSLEMARVWEPMKLALRATLQGGVRPQDAGTLADRRYRALYRQPPRSARALPYEIVLGVFLLLGFLWKLRGGLCGRFFLRDYPHFWRAMAYMSPAATGVLVLILVPFAYGFGMSFFHYDSGHYTFVGLANFSDILFSRDYRATEPMSFYFTLAVTVLWTAVNVALHVGIGLALALMLKSPLLRLKGFFRVILILPWAIPNYITALIWKGMFHRQFGAINGILAALGVNSISWFSRFFTAFAANIVTNTWLGFPFMMVVALGALQSIPQDLYEAAEVDGASSWTQFRRVTLPLIRPAMLPSIILGVIWTFNMFNIIYLVSGGEPGGSTDILVSEAYRWAFERNEQYGFAAAYAVLIFFILLAYSSLTQRIVEKGARNRA